MIQLFNRKIVMLISSKLTGSRIIHLFPSRKNRSPDIGMTNCVLAVPDVTAYSDISQELKFGVAALLLFQVFPDKFLHENLRSSTNQIEFRGDTEILCLRFP